MSVNDNLGNSNYPLPVGTVLAYAGTALPRDYLLCDGASVSKTAYSHLYAVIGNTYGETTTTFALPNLVGQVITGAAVNGTANTIAGGTGTLTATLTASNIPPLTLTPSFSNGLTYTASVNGGTGVTQPNNSGQTDQIAPGTAQFIPTNTTVSRQVNVSETNQSNLSISRAGSSTPISKSLGNLNPAPTAYNLLYIIKARSRL